MLACRSTCPGKSGQVAKTSAQGWKEIPCRIPEPADGAEKHLAFPAHESTLSAFLCGGVFIYAMEKDDRVYRRTGEQ